jgi:acyl-CoA hydrolase
MVDNSELGPRELKMTVLATPDMVNFSGNIHGGAVLKLLDQVAYCCAVQYSKQYCVTLAVERVVFMGPIHVGELVTFLALVNYVGRTSMEIGIKVISGAPKENTVRHVVSCFFTMVAVDEQRKPTLVPSFTPKSPEEIRRWEKAKLRRKNGVKIP